MADRSDFARKYYDPRWYERRQQVLDDYGPECQLCGTESESPEVHHKYYRKDTDPWDYPEPAYAVLCPDCHEEETPLRTEARQRLVEGVMGQVLAGHTLELAIVLEEALESMGLPEVTCEALTLFIQDKANVTRIVTAYAKDMGHEL